MHYEKMFLSYLIICNYFQIYYAFVCIILVAFFNSMKTYVTQAYMQLGGRSIIVGAEPKRTADSAPREQGASPAKCHEGWSQATVVPATPGADNNVVIWRDCSS